MPERITEIEAMRHENLQLKLALVQAEMRVLSSEVYAAHGLRPGIDVIRPDGTIVRAAPTQPNGAEHGEAEASSAT